MMIAVAITLLAVLVVGLAAAVYLMWAKLNPDPQTDELPPESTIDLPDPEFTSAEEIEQQKEKMYRKRQVRGFVLDAILMVTGVLLFWYSESLILWFDPSAGTFEHGQLQRMLYAILGLFMAAGVSSVLFKLRFPLMYKYLLGEGNDDFLEISIRDRVWLVILIFLSFMLCFTLLAGNM